ncbi:MAG: ribose-phosphate pyrophosphokinase [Candidatus Woesearchaeota archaeon]
MSKIKIFSGTAHLELTKKICSYLNVPLSETIIKRFPDSEIYFKSKEVVRGDEIFIIQPTCNPVNENLMELFIMIDAFKRSSVGKINVVMPYFGYARQDRRASAREPITAKLIANLLTKAGADRIITIDLHSPQIVGFFDIDVDHFEAYPLFAQYILKNFTKDDLNNIIAVASDAGFVKKTRKFAKLLDCPLAIIDKRRPYHSEVEIVNVIGDVENKVCILLDDMIDTANTITAGADALINKGAKSVYIFATHAVLSNDAAQKLKNCKAKEIIITDTIPIKEEQKFDKLKIFSLAEILAQVIERIHDKRSLGELFSWEEKLDVGIKREK